MITIGTTITDFLTACREIVTYPTEAEAELLLDVPEIGEILWEQLPYGQEGKAIGLLLDHARYCDGERAKMGSPGGGGPGRRE